MRGVILHLRESPSDWSPDIARALVGEPPISSGPYISSGSVVVSHSFSGDLAFAWDGCVASPRSR